MVQAQVPVSSSYSDFPPLTTSSTPTKGSKPDSNNHSSRKKRKIDRACDHCRRRKTKCDGVKMPNNICTNCAQNQKECTYVEASKPRGPPKAYVIGLEDRMEMLEDLLEKLRPGVDFSEELGPCVIRDSWKAENSSRARNPQPVHPEPDARTRSSDVLAMGAKGIVVPMSAASPQDWLPASSETQGIVMSTQLSLKPKSRLRPRPSISEPKLRVDMWALRTAPEEADLSSDGSESENEIPVMSSSGDLMTLKLQGFGSNGDELGQGSHRRFHGKACMLQEIVATRMAKEKHFSQAGADGIDPQLRELLGNAMGPGKVSKETRRRPEFWTTPPWELEWEGLQNDTSTLITALLAQFPPPDLAPTLIDLYFVHCNFIFPLLHRPTFNAHWTDGLHFRDAWFACVCLSVFAIGGRWCDDPRSLANETPKGGSSNRWERNEHSAGWAYIQAAMTVHHARSSLLHPTCLFEVQSYSLIAMFYRGSQSSPVGWLFTGIGLRKMQDIGAHQSKVYSRDNPSVEDELWRRAFWLLVAFDRIGSVALGRPCCINEEDFDVGLPLEVDDEFWEADDPALAFQQPAGRPSTVTAFNLWVKLTQIMAFVARTMYTTDKSKMLLCVKVHGLKAEVILQVSKALNDWLQLVPDHLKWSPTMDNQIFANQAATMFTTYYMVHVLIYRPFATANHSSMLTSSSTSSPSPACDAATATTHCINAARACARIVEGQMRRGYSNVSGLLAISGVGAALLLVEVWAKQKAEQMTAEDVKPPARLHSEVSLEELLADVKIFMDALEWAAVKWEHAAQLLKPLKASLPGSNDERAQAAIAPVQSDQKEGRTSSNGASQQRHLPPITTNQSASGRKWEWYVTAGYPHQQVGDTATAYAPVMGHAGGVGSGTARRYVDTYASSVGNPGYHPSASVGFPAHHLQSIVDPLEAMPGPWGQGDLASHRWDEWTEPRSGVEIQSAPATAVHHNHHGSYYIQSHDQGVYTRPDYVGSYEP